MEALVFVQTFPDCELLRTTCEGTFFFGFKAVFLFKMYNMMNSELRLKPENLLCHEVASDGHASSVEDKVSPEAHVTLRVGRCRGLCGTQLCSLLLSRSQISPDPGIKVPVFCSGL